MALTDLTAAPLAGVRYDPEVIDADLLRAMLAPAPLMGAEAVAEEEELPADLARLLDEGGSEEEALAALERAVVEEGLLAEELRAGTEGPLMAGDPAAAFRALAGELAPVREPAAGQVSEEIVAQNMDSFRIFDLEEADQEFRIFVGGKLATTMPLMGAKASRIDQLIASIQLLLDSLSLGFALLSVAVTAGKTWAKKLSDSLKKPKNWLSIAKKGFGHFRKAYTAFQDATGKSDKKDAKGRRRDAALNTMSKFASAFLGFVGTVFKQALWVVRAILKLIFGSLREVAKMVLQLLKAAIQWAAWGPVKLATAIIDAVLAALAVWDDVDAMRKVF